MSISTIQEKLFNKGCGSALIVIAAVAMGASMFTSQCGRDDRMNGEGGGAGAPIASVGDVSVTAQGIQAEAQAIQERNGGGRTPMAEAVSLAMATSQTLDNAAIRSLIAKGPTVTASEIEKAAQTYVDARLESIKGSMTGQGLLKPGATEADFEKALKAQLNGKTLAQYRAGEVDGLKKQFAAQETKAAVVDLLGRAILVARYGEKGAGTDQELRDSYKTFVVKRIFFSPQSGSTEAPAARAAKAEADLKAGTGFDKLMDTMSNDAPMPGKTPHEATRLVAASDFNALPEYAALKGKAPGATTGIVDVDGGKAIYRLDSVRDDAPPDFDANKAKYRVEKARSAGQESLQKAVRDLVASTKWESKGFQALAGAVEAQGNPAGTAKVIEMAQTAVKSENPGEKRLGAFALLIATMPSPMAAPDPAKSAPRLAALETVLSLGLEDPAISLELADLYGAAKDGAKATGALVAASKGNLRYDTEGERTFRDVATKVRKLSDAKVLNADQVKEIEAQQALWRAARTDSAKAVATGEKANEAEIARQKAEAAKAAGGTTTTVRPATDAEKANAAEIARQKAEAAKGKGK